MAGCWCYPYWAMDQFCQIIDALTAEQRNLAAARRFFTQALSYGPRLVEVNTDRAICYSRVVDEWLPAAHHVVQRYANNPIEADHSRFKARLRPMRSLERLRPATVIVAAPVFMQSFRRGHYELAVNVDPKCRLPATFAELALTV